MDASHKLVHTVAEGSLTSSAPQMAPSILYGMDVNKIFSLYIPFSLFLFGDFKGLSWLDSLVGSHDALLQFIFSVSLGWNRGACQVSMFLQVYITKKR